MPRTPAAVSALLALAALAGCSTTKPAERYPGFVDAAPETCATLRESDNAYIETIDGRKHDDHFDFSLLSTPTYRQYLIPEGKHEIGVRYFERSGAAVISRPAVPLTVTLQRGTPYTLKANRDFIVGPFMKNEWRPSLTNDTTKQVVAQTTAH